MKKLCWGHAASTSWSMLYLGGTIIGMWAQWAVSNDIPIWYVCSHLGFWVGFGLCIASMFMPHVHKETL